MGRISHRLVSLAIGLGFLTWCAAAAAACPDTAINETDICRDVNRTDVVVLLPTIQHENITTYACAVNLSALTNSDVLQLLLSMENGTISFNTPQLTLLFTKLNETQLELGLEAFNNQMRNTIRVQFKDIFLTALWNAKLSNQTHFNGSGFVEAWFQRRLRPFLSAVNTVILQCLSTAPIGCQAFQAMVTGLDTAYSSMTPVTREEVYRTFKNILNKTKNDDACVTGVTSNSSDWIQKNFGTFRSVGQFQDFITLNQNITGLDVLNLLTVKQLAQFSFIKGSLKNSSDVQSVMSFVAGTAAAQEYMEEFNRQGNVTLPANIRYELLNQVLLKVNLSTANDTEFSIWIGSRLINLLPAVNDTIVSSLYTTVQSKNCSTIKNMTGVLNNLINQFDTTTKRAVYNGILGTEKGGFLRCYSNASSFSVYLMDTFQAFAKLLDLGDAVAIVPPGKFSEVVNSIPVESLTGFLSSPDFIKNNYSALTSVLLNYNNKSGFIEHFNQGPVATLSNETKAAILAGVWPAVVNNNNTIDIDQWFGSRLKPYLNLINTDLLNSEVTKGATCLSFRNIVKTLNENITLFAGQEKDFYSSIKTYLTVGGSQPKCYNSSDQSWLATYLGQFIQYSTVDDLQALTINSSLLQDLVVNNQNLQLIGGLQLQDGVGSLFTTAVFAKNPDFNISNLPDKLLCFMQGANGIKNLSNQELFGIINKINNVCVVQNNSNSTDSAPSSVDLQLAASLVERLSTINSSTVANLGQQAVGLNTRQIKNMNSIDVIGSLDSLGKVKGWDAGQAQGLINKLLVGNFQFNSSASFKQLGSLVSGLPSSVVSSISPALTVSLAEDQGFVRSMEASPVYLQQAFVGKVVATSNASTQALLDKVPDSLAAAIPNSMLDFGVAKPDVKSIGKKSWSKDQASGFFGTVLQATTKYSDLSASVLQGFQCSSGSSLTPDNFSSLVSEMKRSGVALDGVQASCLAKLSNSKPVIEFSKYPADALLFFDMNSVDDKTCQAFIKQASKGNINNLAGNPVQKKKLLDKSASCLSIDNTGILTKDQLSSLGGLVCLMDPSTIAKSDPQILENLKLCPDLSDAQQSALQGVINSNRTTYGSPSTWNRGTFASLGKLSYYLNSTILGSVNQDVAKDFFKSAIGEFKGQGASKDKLKTFVKSFLTSKRSKRGAGCIAGNITASSIQAPDFLLTYQDVAQFELCLDEDVLLANLAALANQPFTDEYVTVIKTKLNMIYPQGVPEDSLKLMGASLQRLYSGAEISKWNITTEDTLAILMNAKDPAWNASQAKQILTNYLWVQALTATALKNTGGMYMCYLDAAQIQNITTAALKDAGKLDVSTCSQDKKDVLYGISKLAFASQLNSSSYYPSIQPYLGGAPVADLKNLVNVSMNIQTFIGLKPSEVPLLSVSDVKSLLGVNVADLKTFETDPVIINWIKSRSQSELDALGLDLSGGLVPTGCLIVPNATEKYICNGVNSTGIVAQLPNIVPGNVSLYSCANGSELISVNSSNILQLMNSMVNGTVTFTTPQLTLLFTKLKRAQLELALEAFNTQTLNTSAVPSKGIFLTALWSILLGDQSSFKDTGSAETWFQRKLRPFLSAVSSDMLLCLHNVSIGCPTYQAILKGLISEFDNMSPTTQSAAYNSFVKVYLQVTYPSMAGSTEPRCYNTSDRSWLASYLGRFIQYSTVDDLRALTGSASVLQDLSVNELNLQLINMTQLQDGVGAMYATALFDKNSSFNLDLLPDKLLCFAQGSSAIKNLPNEKLLAFVSKINKQCSAQTSPNDTVPVPSPSNLQLAASLVEGLLVIDASTVAALGQQAVGLNMGQIKKMNSTDLINSLGSLGKVRGWDAGQAQGLVNKLLDGKFTFNTADKFKQLGSLVVGLPSTVINDMTAVDALNLTSDATFVTTMQASPVYLKQAFVKKLSTDTSSWEKVPDSLVDAIPNSLVTFGNQSINVLAISKKNWSKSQASGFFGNVLKMTSNYADLSPSVLQGSQCSSVSSLTAANIISLLSEMKKKGAALDSVQSGCLAKLGQSKLSIDYLNYPPNVLIFSNLDNLTFSCQDFFKAASEGNVNILADNPTQKNKLVQNLNACFPLNVNGGLNNTQLSSLGGLVCLMNPAIITKSDPQIVENLKLCPELSDAQKSALQEVVSSGKTSYGLPSTWNLGTISKLGQLSYYMNFSTVSDVDLRREVFKGAMGAFKSKSVPRGILKKFTASFSSSTRTKRGAGCTVGNITASTIQDPTFVINYPDVTQFNLCLDNDVLTANLAALASQPLPDSYLKVVKDKLDQVYPQGIPEESVKVMGAALQRLYSDTEISKWNITSEDTLTILMNAEDAPWNASQAKQILSGYLSKGNSLTATALKNTGGANICTLEIAQINTITAAALKDAGTLDISTCSQEKKDALYTTAKSAFSSQIGTPAYYSSVEPYLGGASATDLKSLGSVSMSVPTFNTLKLNEVKLLSVSDVKTLLGANLDDLKSYENSTVVQGWIKSQKQSDLDTLQLGLTGGLVPSYTLPPGYVIVSPAAASATVPSLCFLQAWIYSIGFLVLRGVL